MAHDQQVDEDAGRRHIIAQSLTDVHQKRCRALGAAIGEGAFTDLNPVAMFIDIDAVNANVDALSGAGYPEGTLHTIAVKANPTGGVLKLFKDRGMGAEVASFGELQQALLVGFPPNMVVFDSPAKTLLEMRFALSKGVRTNVDNWQEFDRLVNLMEENPEWAQMGTMIGVRINPQVGTGSIAALSTGGAVSKFGVPLLEHRERLVEEFVKHPWLNMLHLHTGSQGLATSMIVDGVERVWALAQEINAACGEPRVRVLDIGGGLTVNFDDDEAPEETRFHEQARLLRERLPELFQPGAPQLMTENGRSMLAKVGFAAATVEYTKYSGGRRIAVNHMGADLLVRMVLLPAVWRFRTFVCNAKGASKESTAEWEHQDIAGPLCFQGDKLADNAYLPLVEVGDHVVVVDVGAYALSMYSRYNSRTAPSVWGYAEPAGAAGGVELRLLRRGDTMQEVLAFWNQM